MLSIKPMRGVHARGDGLLSAKERHLGMACGAGFRFQGLGFELCEVLMGSGTTIGTCFEGLV